MRSWDAWRELLADRALPAAIVDLDALDHNLGVLTGALGQGLTLRVASKSIRVPALFRYLQTRGGGRLRGLMTYSAQETAWLADQGFDDLLLGYPISRPAEAVALATAARKATLWVVVDGIDQARVLSSAARGAGVTLRLCLDVDASWRPGAATHFGVRRSPLREASQVVALATAIRDLPGLQVDALLAYEAQVAGLSDTPGPSVRDQVEGWVKALVKRRSIGLVAERRRAVLEGLRAAGFPVSLVNGGGSGSVHSTSADPTVTEVTAGSGFLDSHLFDGYADLPWQPAAFFALGVCRQSDPDHVTCTGGGYIASGPPGPTRLPKVHLPEGLVPVALEGFGEVQTPFRVLPGYTPPKHGDPIVCRHAKAGELAERFASYLLVRGDRVEEIVPTYRGCGQTFA